MATRACQHKKKVTCHCDGRAPHKIPRCPSNTDKNCKVRTYNQYTKDQGYNPSWEEIKQMLGEE